MFVFALYNLKGGVGKTASCVNLAHLAASDGYATLLWDLDPQGAAGFYFGAEAEGKSAVKKMMADQKGLSSLIQPSRYEHLDIIPADLSTRKLDLILDEKSSKKQLKKLLKEVGQEYDFVFIDCPPGFSNLADNIFTAADAVLMPVIPTTLSLRTYDIVRDYLEDKEIGEEKLMCFFSMADTRKTLHNEVMYSLSQDSRFFQYYIPQLSEVEKMGIHHAPVTAYAPNGTAAACYAALWEEIKEGVLE